jgi:U3 small nucleolar RNA-associated protein 10
LTAASRRRAQALIIFVGHAMQSPLSGNLSSDAPVGGTIDDLVLLLIQMTTLRGGSTVESNVDHLSKAAQSTISRSLSVMPAADFISAVLAMLKSEDEIVSINRKYYIL